MSRQLTLDVSDETYAVLQQKASEAGLSAAEWLLELADRQRQDFSNARTAKDGPGKSFKDYAGTFGDVGSVNNEDIDADLAKDYANEY